MYFFEDVRLLPGVRRRYRPEVLGVKLRGRNISDVLQMTVDEAVDFFATQNGLARCRRSVVGLGYLRLGQAATTLSGGEAQRLKIAAELGARPTGEMLYILDEPTTGPTRRRQEAPGSAQSTRRCREHGAGRRAPPGCHQVGGSPSISAPRAARTAARSSPRARPRRSPRPRLVHRQVPAEVLPRPSGRNGHP